MSKNFLILNGTLPDTTDAPLFNDVFPSLIDPDSRAFVDTFQGAAAGTLNARVLPTAPTTEAWFTSDINITADGYVAPNNATGLKAAYFTPDDPADAQNGQWACTVENKGSGRAGVLFRGTAADTFWFAGLSFSSSVVILARYSSGTNAESITSAITTVADQYHTVRAVADGDNIKVYVDDRLHIDTDSGTELQTGTRMGVAFASAVARIHEFMASGS